MLTSAMPTILYVSNAEQQCGVYQFGRRIGEVLVRSKRYAFRYVECNDVGALRRVIADARPAAIIYNSHPQTTPWLTTLVVRSIPVPQIGTIHEVTQEAADAANSHLFNYHIAPDPTLVLKNLAVFKTGRLIPEYENPLPPPEKLTIGSFGFGLEGKGFDLLIAAVEREFDHAAIRLHIANSFYADPDGSKARAVVDACERMVTKPGIELSINQTFLDDRQLLDFLAGNSLNAFFYDEYRNRGISSVIDYALAVGRPIAITKSEMFRHIRSASPSICIEDSSLKSIISNDIQPLRGFQEEWVPANLVWDYERIVDAVLAREKAQPAGKPLHPLVRKARSAVRRLLGRRRQSTPVGTSLWAQRNTQGYIAHNGAANGVYHPISLPPTASLNGILDNAARARYQPAVDELFRLAPEIMARKIPEANVQQAFVFDTVTRLAPKDGSPKVLCIGSYEDTACMALKASGYQVDDVDPLLNYDLGVFVTKPTTKMGTYEVILCTSVIEHVNDDETFMSQVAALLAPGGVAVFTCDFQDQYKPGDHKPASDVRLYTSRDLRERVLPRLTHCQLVDAANWDCPNPDFLYENCHYTFAGLVVRKGSK